MTPGRIVEPTEREEDAVLEHREEASPELGPGQASFNEAVLRRIVDLQIELDAEVALVPRRLHELTRPAPDDRRAATELLPVGVTEEVVIDARAEVVRPLDLGEDVAEEDEIDPVVGVEGEGRDGPLTAVQLVARAAGVAVRERRRPRIAARPAEAELEVELVLDGAELGLAVAQAELPTCAALALAFGFQDWYCWRGCFDSGPTSPRTPPRRGASSRGTGPRRPASPPRRVAPRGRC